MKELLEKLIPIIEEIDTTIEEQKDPERALQLLRQAAVILEEMMISVDTVGTIMNLISNLKHQNECTNPLCPVHGNLGGEPNLN